MQLTADSRQTLEVRDQMSEVKGNLLSDLRLLTSVMGDLNDLSNGQRTTDNGQLTNL